MYNNDNSRYRNNVWSHLNGGVSLVFILGVFLVELMGCESKSKVSDEDFSGHTFAAAIADSADRFGLRKPGVSVTQLKVEYLFNEDKTGQVRVQQGPSTNLFPFTWQVQGDSMMVTMNNNEGGFLIQKDPNGYTLSNKNLTVMLTD